VKSGVCPKCSCTVIVEGLRVLDRGPGGADYDLSVAAYAEPDGPPSKGKVTHGALWACVCGACGFTEFYATNLNALVRTAAEAQARAKPETDPGATPDGGA
jgi:predicted nucleic-acid-binding Zn-ribbon protein